MGIYSSKSHLENYLTEDIRSRYAVWVAHYGVEKTSYTGQFGIWQKSSTGKINGISGNVDLNECYIDYPAEIRKAELNGFAGKPTVSQNKYIEYTVKRGDSLWNLAEKFLGNGARYKEIMYASAITSEKIYPKQRLFIPEK